MEGEGATAALEVLVQNLIKVCRDEISLIRGLEKEAERLEETLAMIQSFLDDADNKSIADNAVKGWLKKLEDVAFDADNVLDELKYHRLSKELMETRETEKKKVPSCFPSIDHYHRRRKMALGIKKISKTFKSINKEAEELGLQRKLANAPAVPDGGEETTSFALDPIVIGRDNDLVQIVEKLTSSQTEEVFSILPIVGMGGVGKTTLARKVFHDEKIRAHFETQHWVHVPKNFNKVFKEILTKLKPGQNVEAMSSEVILEKLQEALAAKTYLLVLDDVWNQDQQNWQVFVNSLTGMSSVKGNAVIFTTRSTAVASIVRTLPMHKLEGLTEEDCWSIIKAKSFGEEDIPQELETVGRNIAKKCQGLPLAANIIGGALFRKSKDEWVSIAENWLSQLEGDGSDNISKILKLSFDKLSSPSLKKCFAYCSIFPKGALIDRAQLIELWMAEGFIQPEQRNNMEAVGDKFFKILLQNSLLQHANSLLLHGDSLLQHDIDKTAYCSMHDLVHDLASSVLGSSNVNRYIGRDHHGDKSSPISEEQAKCLRTLFFKGEIPNTMFSNFECLHVLTLMGYDVTELPSSIRKLIHLRYLDISRTRIEYLPDSIRELHHLQTLRSGSEDSFWRLKKLPNTLKYLINLKHLHIHSATELPPDLGRLTSLQTLTFFKVEDKNGHRIVELGSLKNLEGRLKIINLENVHGKEEAKKAYLSEKPKLMALTFRWVERKGSGGKDENVLEGLQPHPDLKSLEIDGFKGTSFPSWTLKMEGEVKGRWIGLNNLVNLRLENCKKCEEIPMLGHLPLLKYLILSGLENVRSIGSSFYGIDNCSPNNGVTNVFPALKRLQLMWMPKLKEWVEVNSPSTAENQPREIKVFSCLEYLEIVGCEKLKSAPSDFPFLKELYVDEMTSGLPLANICGTKLGSLTNLTITDLDGLVCLPDWLFHNNQNLAVLEISLCFDLTELPDGLHSLFSLEELSIKGCPFLKSIKFPPSLKFPLSLKKLSLRELRNLTNLPMVIDCLPKIPHLKTLEIVDVPQFITSFPTEIGNLPSLQTLIIRPFLDSSSNCGSFKKTVDWILQGSSQSLNRLDLSGMGHWDSLPDGLRHLTALSVLELGEFGIEVLPEWFSNLSSLENLRLCDCKKLKRLPSKEAIQCLTKLKHLQIKGCSLLEKRCIEQQNDDSEWPKISHISDIQLGYNRFRDGRIQR